MDGKQNKDKFFNGFWVSVVTALAQNHLSLEIKSFERHAAIGWNHSGEAATYFQIFTAEEGEDFKEVFKSTSDSYLHFTDANTLENYRIYVRALNGLSQPLQFLIQLQ